MGWFSFKKYHSFPFCSFLSFTLQIAFTLLFILAGLGIAVVVFGRFSTFDFLSFDYNLTKQFSKSLSNQPSFVFTYKTIYIFIFFHRYTLDFWDVGGQKSLRSYWRNYFEKTDGLIWVRYVCLFLLVNLRIMIWFRNTAGNIQSTNEAVVYL